MDPIAASSIVQSQANLVSQMGVSMLKKTLEIQADQGAQLVQMMNQANGVGRSIDLQG